MFEPLTRSLVSAIRTTGHIFDLTGRSLECNAFVDKLQPALKNVKYAGTSPAVKAAFVAPCATVVGKVNIGSSSSVWYGAVVRGDVNTIKIGDNVSIGDRVMVHCSGTKSEYATTVGNNVLIRPGAIIHGATLEEGCFVGEGAQVMDGAKVGKNSIILPGAVVPPGKAVPANQVWGGCPAKMVREVTNMDAQSTAEQLESSSADARLHATETAKSWQEILLDEEEEYQIKNRQPYYYRRQNREEWARQYEDPREHKYPGRVMNNELSAHKHHKAFRPE